MSKIVARVAKLQKLATENTNVNEAASAAEQALRIMREHAISQADVDALLTAVSDPLIERHLYLDGIRLVPREEKSRYAGKTAGWKRALAVAVSNYMGLRHSYYPGRGGFNFYGHTSDTEAAMKLYNVCARQIDIQCKDWLVGEGERQTAIGRFWDKSTARSAGFSFRESAVKGLESKFEELQEESAEDHADGHALVLSRAQKVSDWVDATYTFAKATSADEHAFGGRVDHCGDGYKAGRKLRLAEDAELEDRAPRGLEDKAR